MLERDDQRRALARRDGVDAKVKTVRSTLRFSYEEPTAIRWVQEKGETKSLTGSWTFEDLGDGQTRATYALDADPAACSACCCAARPRRRCATSCSATPPRG